MKLTMGGMSDDLPFINGEEYGGSEATAKVTHPDGTTAEYTVEYGYSGWQVTIEIPDGSTIEVWQDGDVPCPGGCGKPRNEDDIENNWDEHECDA